MSTPTATPRTQALWEKHHAFCNEGEAAEALCDFRDHGNALETELAAAKAELVRFKESTWEHQEFNRNNAVARSVERDNDKDELARLRAELEAANKHCDILKESNCRACAEVERLNGALALGQENCDAIYNDMREERTELRARADRAEAEVERLNNRAVFDTCDMGHNFLKLNGESTRCPKCLAQGLTESRAEVERLKGSCEFTDFQRQQARAERAEASLAIEQWLKECAIKRTGEVMAERDALAKDKARLDWLEYHGWITGEPCDRAAIDAAMKS